MNRILRITLCCGMLLAAGCAIPGGRRLVGPASPGITSLPADLEGPARYIRHYYGDTAAAEYLNQPAAFRPHFVANLLSQDSEGQRCINFLRTGKPGSPAARADCLLMLSLGNQPQWSSERTFPGGTAEVHEFLFFPDLYYVFTVSGEIAGAEHFRIEADMNDRLWLSWQNPGSGRRRKAGSLKAAEMPGALQPECGPGRSFLNDEVLSYRKIILGRNPFPGSEVRPGDAGETK